jgi:hypothetical protein
MSKKKLNEWNDESFKKQPKRWTTKFNGPDSTSLTEFEKLKRRVERINKLLKILRILET